MVNLEEQSAAITAVEGNSLDLHKLVKAVEDSQLGVKDVKVVIKGRLIEHEGRPAITEDAGGAVFLIAEGFEAGKKMMGKEVRLTGRVHALKKDDTPPHLVVEDIEVIGRE